MHVAFGRAIARQVYNDPDKIPPHIRSEVIQYTSDYQNITYLHRFQSCWKYLRTTSNAWVNHPSNMYPMQLPCYHVPLVCIFLLCSRIEIHTTPALVLLTEDSSATYSSLIQPTLHPSPPDDRCISSTGSVLCHHGGS